MEIQFWGVRGSHPVPLTPSYIREKIAAVVQRIKQTDILDQDARENFLASLPEEIFNTPGGNTTCIEVKTQSPEFLIVDAGSGIVELGKKLKTISQKNPVYHIFFSHFHYDHIQGLPFFSPAYNPGATVHFYSPEPDIEFTLRDHMKHPYFPVTMEGYMTKRLHFHVIQKDEPIQITKTCNVTCHEVRHPGRAYGYKFEEDQKSLVLVPDYEILEQDFLANQDAESFFHGSDLLVLDTMYTLGESIEKINWGHSSYSLGIEFAHRMQIPHLCLFHHEPLNDDKKMYTNLRSARWFAQRLTGGTMKVSLAEEGVVITL
jgi:phosphoribosyl 1,2-cyclic phosphodiesterase